MSSQLQNKLLHYEVPPPDGVWNRVAASLDETGLPQLSEKLSAYEEVPPSQVWQKIKTELDQSKTRVIPFHVRYRRHLKYSGTVAFFVVIAMTVALLISKKTESEGENNPPVTVSKDSNGFKNQVTKSFEDTSGNSNVTAKTPTSKTISPETNTIVTNSCSDKYMILNDANGNAIRLPKKLYTAFVCPTNNADCKERLERLRAKFAASAVTSDFTGILQILKSLQENQ